MSNNKSPEERAREYAPKADESRRGFLDFIIVETKYKSFLDGYHSRDTEVAELREVLKHLAVLCDANSIDEVVFYEQEHNVDLETIITKAKQLLDDEKKETV